MCTLAVHPRSLAFGAVLGLPLVLCKHGTGTPPACAHVACRASWCILTLGEKPAKTRGKEKTTHSLGNTSASVLFFLPRFFFSSLVFPKCMWALPCFAHVPLKRRTRIPSTAQATSSLGSNRFCPIVLGRPRGGSRKSASEGILLPVSSVCRKLRNGVGTRAGRRNSMG